MLNEITITTGRSRYEKSWRPQTLLLSELWERLRSPARGAETISEYLSLPKSKQDDLKDVGGFVAGALAGDRRKAGAVAGRDVLTLDLDNIPNGATEAWLNITYNYADWYYRPGVFARTKKASKGIRTIYGMTGVESIPVLKKAISKLESMDEDISEKERRKCEEQGATGYWLPTRENAIKPLRKLVALAQMRPDGVWEGD